MLCSDGLSDMLYHEDMEQYIKKGQLPMIYAETGRSRGQR